MFVADAHCDTLYEIALCGTAPEQCVITPERLAAGGVGIQTFALFCGKHGTQGTAYMDGAVVGTQSFVAMATAAFERQYSPRLMLA